MSEAVLVWQGHEDGQTLVGANAIWAATGCVT